MSRGWLGGLSWAHHDDEERAEEYRLEAAVERRERTLAGRIELGGCPQCRHESFTVSEAYGPTLVDPGWSRGRCRCADGPNYPCAACSTTECYETEPYIMLACDCECHCGCDYEE